MVEQACDWRRLDEAERKATPCPPLPWAWHMAVWCLDTAASYKERYVFRHPYPRDGRSWLEQRRWNEYPLMAMRHAIKAELVYGKEPTKRSDDELKFDREQMRGCQMLDEYLGSLGHH